MPDIDITKADTQTAIILLYQSMNGLIDAFEEFKKEDKEWKEEFKSCREKDIEQFNRLNEFMITKKTENGFHQQQEQEDKKRIANCYKRFQRYDEVYQWVDGFKKVFWLIISVFITGIITNLISFFKFNPHGK